MTALGIAIRSIVFPLIVSAFVFIPAGRWDLPFVWAYLGLIGVFYLAIAASADAGSTQQRRRPGLGSRDRLTGFLGLPLLLGHWIFAGLDAGRLEWSLVRWEFQIAGVVGYAVALALNYWAMRANPFYSPVAQLPDEQDERPIADGPYRIVRHPGYAAMSAALLFGGIALGSWLAMLPIVGFAALFVRRTLLEDHMLQQELAGYTDYAAAVRYRLIPGVF